jgi:hypothetical protein
MRDSEFQELIRRHPEVKPLFERVGGSYRAKPHWRLQAKFKRDSKLRSAALLKAQIALGEIAIASRGKKGFDEEGKPIVSSKIKRGLRGRTFKEKVRVPEWKRMLERIKKEIVVEA